MDNNLPARNASPAIAGGPKDPNSPYATPPEPPSPQSPSPDPNSNPHPKHHPPVLTDEVRHKLSEAAQQRPRDAEGHFLPNEHPKSRIPPIVEVNQNVHPSEKEDPPLINFSITNPVTYLKLFLKRLLKRQAITLRIPVLAIIIIMAGIGGFGVGFQSGLNWALFRLFPNYSPILHRAITEQGTIQKNNKGEYFLKSDGKDQTMWTLKSVSANVKLGDYVGQQVQIKGNLTPTPNLIEVSEVISFETEAEEPSPASPTQRGEPISQTATPISNASPDTATTSAVLPALYSNLKWEAPKNKTLTFTSGIRKIEQEVIYIESLESNTYPSDFISYYTSQLSNSSFKQTLNSQEPDNISITYSKGNLFLTFGIKNVYQGSGDNRELSGYKAFIEHN